MSIRLLTGTVLAALMGAASAQTDSTYPAMYFHSQVRDASICSMDVNKSGDIVFAEGISNPDASCADAAGWMQMLDAIRSEFWTNWANDETVWVASPRPLCTDASPNNCCFVDPGQMPQVGYRDASGNMVRPSDMVGPASTAPTSPVTTAVHTKPLFPAASPSPATTRRFFVLRIRLVLHASRKSKSSTATIPSSVIPPVESCIPRRGSPGSLLGLPVKRPTACPTGPPGRGPAIPRMR